MITESPKENRDGYKQVTFSISKDKDLYLKRTKLEIEEERGIIVTKSEIVNRLIGYLQENPKKLNEIIQ